MYQDIFESATFSLQIRLQSTRYVSDECGDEPTTSRIRFKYRRRRVDAPFLKSVTKKVRI